MTPEQIHGWRWDGVLDNPEAFAEYRRLVRENALPPAEPDQDTRDLREIIGPSFHDEPVDSPYSQRAKASLAEIKERVRREEIAHAVASLRQLRERTHLEQAKAGVEWSIEDLLEEDWRQPEYRNVRER